MRGFRSRSSGLLLRPWAEDLSACCRHWGISSHAIKKSSGTQGNQTAPLIAFNWRIRQSMRKLNELTIVTPFSWTVSLFQCAKQRQKDSKDRECYTGNNPILHNAHSFSTCNLNKISDNRTMMGRTKRYYFFCGSLSNFADGWLFFYFAGTVYDQLSVVFFMGS